MKKSKKDRKSELFSIEEDKYSDDETIIMVYVITDYEVCKFVYNKYKSGQIKTKYFSKYAQEIFKWILQYYSKYSKQPQRHLDDIFIGYKKSLGKKAKIIEELLNSYFQYYYSLKDDDYNPEFIKKDIIPRFVKRNAAEILANEINDNLDRDDLESIEKSLGKFTSITEEDDPDLGTSVPGTLLQVKKYYTQEKDKSALFTFPGALGQLMGPIYRGKLYAFTGVEKSLKSYLMQEIAYYGVVYNKLKVLDINLEMPQEEKNERLWQRAGQFAIDKEHAGKIIHPIFDCENNQFGTCQIMKKKLNKNDLLKTYDDMISFQDRKDWKICTKCRDEKIRLNAHKNKRFIPAIWFTTSNIRVMTEQRISRKIKYLESSGISNYRIKCFPRFSATLDEIIEYSNQYEQNKNFKPHIYIFDYPDITAAVQGKLMDRANIDYNWKVISGFAQKKDAAVFIADQAIKAEREKRSLTNMCTSESKTKDAHLDVRISLNRTQEEEELGLERIGMLFRRKGRKINAEVMLTQRIESGNVIMDSEWWFNHNITYPITKGTR